MLDEESGEGEYVRQWEISSEWGNFCMEFMYALLVNVQEVRSGGGIVSSNVHF